VVLDEGGDDEGGVAEERGGEDKRRGFHGMKNVERAEAWND